MKTSLTPELIADTIENEARRIARRETKYAHQVNYDPKTDSLNFPGAHLGDSQVAGPGFKIGEVMPYTDEAALLDNARELFRVLNYEFARRQ